MTVPIQAFDDLGTNEVDQKTQTQEAAVHHPLHLCVRSIWFWNRSSRRWCRRWHTNRPLTPLLLPIGIWLGHRVNSLVLGNSMDLPYRAVTNDVQVAGLTLVESEYN